MKVAIIGAGTSGLYIAHKLAKKGHEVTVFEKNDSIGNKICSGLFSERILAFVPESEPLIQNRINSVLINFPRKSIEVSFSKQFLVMDHSKLDHLLSDLCRKVGVKIVLGNKVSNIPTDFDRVIGCDGAESVTRKQLGGKEPSLRLGIQGFVPLQTSETTQENFVEAWPCKNGFLWKIPRGDKLEYGVITDINTAHRTFVDFVKEKNILVNNIKAKLVPQGLIIPDNNKITLCGDAAGLTKPWSGGGVVWGFRAADILIENFPNFNSYRRKTKRFFIKKIIFSKIAVTLVYLVGFTIPWMLPKRAKMESDFLL